MPLCLLFTNLKRSELDANIEERMAKCISATAQVPIETVFVLTHCELPAFCAGSKEPSVICQVNAREIFDAGRNLDIYYTRFFGLLKETTRVPGNRLVVQLKSDLAANAQIGE